jgi:hypothetical protein
MTEEEEEEEDVVIRCFCFRQPIASLARRRTNSEAETELLTARRKLHLICTQSNAM